MYQRSSPETIQAMFASIAKNYDRANSSFSFGMHKIWNRKLIQAIGNPRRLLDLCAGTGEIAFGFLKNHPRSKAILLDFCPEMLEIAQKKGVRFKNQFSTLTADAQAIPLKSASVDGVTISYGIRNVQDPERCFREVYRVLQPKGHFAILELTRPSFPPLRLVHKCYTQYVLPTLGMLAARNFAAYRYLAGSVATFTDPSILEQNLKEIGFKKIKSYSLTGGAVTLLIAQKP